MKIVALFSVPFFSIVSIIIGISISTDVAQAQGTDSLDGPTLLLHALSWMTFRENGAIMQEDSLKKKWHGDLVAKYKSDPPQELYHRFVTTFQFGVLKQMTLNEGDACDPNYRQLYRYWYSDTTYRDYFLKYFVLTAYYHQFYPENGPTYPSAYCDYRQGLVCSKSTSKCECPPGSTMSPVPNAPFPPKQRCLIKENEVCTLIDTAANGGKNKPLDNVIAYLIFEPEKPLGCVEGTQCRFTAGNLVTPLCYSTAGSPTWKDDPPAIPYGEECVLELYYSHGRCNGYSCYNYGLSSNIKAGTAPNKTGICVNYLGPFGGMEVRSTSYDHIHSTDTYYYYFSPRFVNGLLTPRHIPLRGQKLFSYKNSSAYYEYYYEEHYSKYMYQGKACSVDRTTRMAKVYKFYLSLLGTPPPGKQYVADESELNAMLDELKDIVKEGDQYGHYYKSPLRICNLKGDGLLCEDTGKGPDSYGNDGVCNISFTEGKSWADYQAAYLDLYNRGINFDDGDEIKATKDSRYFYRHIVLPGPIDPCSSYCSNPGTFCSEVYSDFTFRGEPIYNEDCTVVPGYSIPKRCVETSEEARWTFGACEQVILMEKMGKILEDIFPGETYKKLERGAQCNYQVESLIKKARKDIWSINGYLFLQYVSSNAGDNGFCDAGKLLECKQDNTCGCLEDTATRKSADGQYESDYCYLTDGYCDSDVRDLTVLFPSEQSEMWNHYGDPSQIGPGPDRHGTARIGARYGSQAYWCANGNVCKFLAPKGRVWCGADNTGKTGLEPILPETTPEPTPDPTETTSGSFGGGTSSTAAPVSPPSRKPKPGVPTKAPIRPPAMYSRAGLHCLASEFTLTIAVMFAILRLAFHA